jgi:hypothetical protein
MFFCVRTTGAQINILGFFICSNIDQEVRHRRIVGIHVGWPSKLRLLSTQHTLKSL